MTVYALDTETTGLRQPQPVEVAWIKLDLNPLDINTDEVVTYSNYVERFMPSKSIEAGASKITGIYIEHLEGCRPHTAFELPDDCTHLLGHNIAYDHRALGRPDVTLLCTKELSMLSFDKTKHKGLRNHKLGTLVEFLYPDSYREILANQHGALSDCYSVIYILEKILPKIPYAKTWDDLAILCSQPKGKEELPYNKVLTVLPFGKNKGRHFSQVRTDYLDWLNSQDDLSPSLKQALELELAKRK